MNILPPGDLRNCILALSDTEPEMEKLFQYRFQKGSLKGQNFGNLFLAAMHDIHGDFKKAISYTSKILAVRGNVYPVTYDNINLLARLKNGNIVYGESNISKEVIKQKSKIDRVYFEPEYVKASEDAIKAIKNSDVIIAGPGSLYTSIFPVILIDEIKNELQFFKDNYQLIDNHIDFYYIGKNDRIIPGNKLEKYCQNHSLAYKLLECGHYPFSYFKDFKDILDI